MKCYSKNIFFIFIFLISFCCFGTVNKAVEDDDHIADYEANNLFENRAYGTIYSTDTITASWNESETRQGVFNDGWFLSPYTFEYYPGRPFIYSDGWYYTGVAQGMWARRPSKARFKVNPNRSMVFGSSFQGYDTDVNDSVLTLIRPGFRVVPGSEVDFSAEVRFTNISPNVSKAVHLLVWYYDRNGNRIGDRDFIPNSGAFTPNMWSEKSSTFKIPSNAHSLAIGIYPMTAAEPFDFYNLEVRNISLKGQKPEPVPSGPINVSYVNQNGKKISNDDVYKGYVGDQYTINPKTISGYDWDGIYPSNWNGVYTSSSKNMTYRYNGKQVQNVYAKYLDVMTDEEIKPEMRLPAGKVGNTFNAPSPPYIEGYEWVDTENPTGEYTMNTQYIKYYYQNEKALLEGFDWLPNFTNWSNVEDSNISSNYAFVPTYISDPVEWSSGVHMTEAINSKSDFVGFETNKTDQWIRWDNVGYYNGEQVGLKVKIKSHKSSAYNKQNNIKIRGSDFLTLNYQKNTGGLEVTYEFLDKNQKPLKVSGYWILDNISDAGIIKMKENQLDNIYSISRKDEETPTLLKYKLQDGYFSLMGEGHFGSGSIPTEPPNLREEQLKAVFTYKEQSSIYIDSVLFASHKINDNRLLYDITKNNVKVDFPNPQYNNQEITQIDQKNINKITNDFIQYVPYEKNEYRNQTFKWKMTDQKNHSIFKKPDLNDIKIINELGQDYKDLFNLSYDKQDLLLTPKSDKIDQLYGHYIKIYYPLTFNGLPVEESTVSSNGYLTFQQKLNLIIDNDKKGDAVSKTDINLRAKIIYSYYTDTGQELNASVTTSELITHKYGTPPIKFKDYKFIDSEPKNYQEQIILYTNNQVKLIYEEIIEQDIIWNNMKGIYDKKQDLLRLTGGTIQFDMKTNVLENYWSNQEIIVIDTEEIIPKNEIETVVFEDNILIENKSSLDTVYLLGMFATTLSIQNDDKLNLVNKCESEEQEHYFCSLKEIKGLEKLSSKGRVNLAGMFTGNKYLQKVDLSKSDLNIVDTDFYGQFQGTFSYMSMLKEVNLPSQTKDFEVKYSDLDGYLSYAFLESNNLSLITVEGRDKDAIIDFSNSGLGQQNRKTDNSFIKNSGWIDETMKKSYLKSLGYVSINSNQAVKLSWQPQGNNIKVKLNDAENIYANEEDFKDLGLYDYIHINVYSDSGRVIEKITNDINSNHNIEIGNNGDLIYLENNNLYIKSNELYDKYNTITYTIDLKASAPISLNISVPSIMSFGINKIGVSELRPISSPDPWKLVVETNIPSRNWEIQVVQTTDLAKSKSQIICEGNSQCFVYRDKSGNKQYLSKATPLILNSTHFDLDDQNKNYWTTEWGKKTQNNYGLFFNTENIPSDIKLGTYKTEFLFSMVNAL